MSLVDAVKAKLNPETSGLPTWEIGLYDKEGAWRMFHCKAKDEDQATYNMYKEYKGAKLDYVKRSDRTLEEIEALD